MRPCDSVSGTRWTRCVPPSNLKTRVGALALDRERVLAVALRRAPPSGSPALGVAGEHAVEVAGEQAGLVAARAGADLDDHVLLVVGVALDHREADLLVQRLDPLARAVAISRSSGSLPSSSSSSRAPASSSTARRHSAASFAALEARVRAPDLGVALAVPDHLGVRHLALQLREARLDLLDELLDHRRSSLRRAPSTRSGRPSPGVRVATTRQPAAVSVASRSRSPSNPRGCRGRSSRRARRRPAARAPDASDLRRPRARSSRERKAVAADESRKSSSSGDSGGRPERRAPSASLMACGRGRGGPASRHRGPTSVGPTRFADLGLPDRFCDVVLRDRGGEVHKRAGYGGDGDAADGRDVLRSRVRTRWTRISVDSRPRASSSRRCAPRLPAAGHAARPHRDGSAPPRSQPPAPPRATPPPVAVGVPDRIHPSTAAGSGATRTPVTDRRRSRRRHRGVVPGPALPTASPPAADHRCVASGSIRPPIPTAPELRALYATTSTPMRSSASAAPEVGLGDEDGLERGDRDGELGAVGFAGRQVLELDSGPHHRRGPSGGGAVCR